MVVVKGQDSVLSLPLHQTGRAAGGAFCQHSAGGSEGTQAEVIVVLSGELLHSQRVKRVHLLGQNLEAKTEEGTIHFPINPSASCRDSYRYKKVGAWA